MNTLYLKKRNGQSLVEILIAITIGVIILGVVIGAIVTSLKLQSNAGRAQAATALAHELLENVKVWSESNWGGGIGAASTSTLVTYYLSSSSPFMIATGTESITVGSSTFSRYFYLRDVERVSVDGAIGTGSVDPSTKKVTIVYGGSLIATRTIDVYLTRYVNKSFRQSDWSGGGSQSGPLITPNDRFETSTSNVNYSTTTGSILLNL